MNADLKHFQLTQQIIGIYFDVYNELGMGFLESVYQKSLALALNRLASTFAAG
ncbi:MAG TPA: GxxExxY protein [Pyrinomonadaceae bacterium]|nr:GxxExxY protein [Pyrinomonadaceae bacterium]